MKEPTPRQRYGRESEKKAAQFLRKQKHRIIARNFSTHQGEVDIISLSPDHTLVFTEVRSRHDCTYGHPIETVDSGKQQRVRQAARAFLYAHPIHGDYACRFDIITVVGEGTHAILEHFPDAF